MSDGAKTAIAGVVVVGLLYYLYTSTGSAAIPAGAPGGGGGLGGPVLGFGPNGPTVSAPITSPFAPGATSGQTGAFAGGRGLPFIVGTPSKPGTTSTRVACPYGHTGARCNPAPTGSGAAGTSSTGYTRPVTVPTVTTPIASGPTGIKLGYTPPIQQPPSALATFRTSTSVGGFKI